MKKLILAATGLFVFTLVNAQTLDDIVKKYSAANKLDKISALSSIKISAKTSVMGNDMAVVTWMKNPDKVKIVTTISGQDIVMVYDGEKGYMINPMMGSNDPVEVDPAQAKQQIVSRSLFQNNLLNMYKSGSISLEGEETVKDKPAFKIKETLDGGNVAYLYIDKATYLPVKANATVSQGGQTFSVDSYPSDFAETDGIILPMKTTQSMSGMEILTTIEKVEVNLPMDDNIFKIKQ